jgi:hypothetical protein
MTIDEAIRDCIAQVPEIIRVGELVGPENWHQHDDTAAVEAFFFHAGYLMLPNTFEFVIRRGGTHPETWCVWGQDADQIWELKYQGPTEFHAMRAAVLLAKGLKP